MLVKVDEKISGRVITPQQVLAVFGEQHDTVGSNQQARDQPGPDQIDEYFCLWGLQQSYGVISRNQWQDSAKWVRTITQLVSCSNGQVDDQGRLDHVTKIYNSGDTARLGLVHQQIIRVHVAVNDLCP